MPYLKQYFTFFILLLFFFNLSGYYLSFVIRRSFARDEMELKIKENLQEELLVKFTFPVGEKNMDLKWEKEGKEFLYKGNLYDVVKTISANDSTTYICLLDKDEQMLVSKFLVLFKKQQEKENKTKSNQLKDYSKYKIDDGIQFFPVQSIYELTSEEFSFFTSHKKDIISPPPEYNIS
jgi:hypothetical protein